jgi:UrcA family protein
MRVGDFHFALATVGCFAVSGPSLAQQAPEVVVEAPHVVTTTGERGRELYSLVYKVNYADLNLATHSGAVELEKRVKDTATKACAQLRKLYPLSEDTNPPCVDAATKKAMTQANQVIVAAEKGAK